jgi:hypothetical protein
MDIPLTVASAYELDHLSDFSVLHGEMTPSATMGVLGLANV